MPALSHVRAGRGAAAEAALALAIQRADEAERETEREHDRRAQEASRMEQQTALLRKALEEVNLAVSR